MRHVNRKVIGFLHSGKPVFEQRGGSDDDGSANGNQTADDGNGDGAADEGDDSDDDGDDDDDDDKPLGEEGEKALRAWKQRARTAERDLKKIKREQPKPAAKDDNDDGKVDEDKLRAEVEQQIAGEYAQERALDKLETKAAKKFADPEDARALLARDVDNFLDEDGKPDIEAIEEALEELLEKKPHLAAQRSKWEGSGDGGARQSKPQRPKSLAEAVKKHYAK